MTSMHIPRNSGNKKWRDAYQPKINKDIRAAEGDGEVAADPGVDDRVMTSSEGPHRPWLVPGAGRL
jgi:hypothetical protein